MTGTIFTSPSSSSSSGSKSAEVEGMTMGSGSSCKADSTSNSSISSSCPSWWPRLSIDFGSWKISFGRGKTRFASDGFGLLLDSPPFCDCHKESSMASTEEHGEDAGETWMMFGEESIGSPRETRPESRRSSSCSNRWNRSCTGSNDSWREACASSRWESKQIEIEIEWEAKEKQDMTCFTESEQWLPTCRSIRGGTWFDGNDMFEAIHQTVNPKIKKWKKLISKPGGLGRSGEPRVLPSRPHTPGHWSLKIVNFGETVENIVGWLNAPAVLSATFCSGTPDISNKELFFDPSKNLIFLWVQA